MTRKTAELLIAAGTAAQIEKYAAAGADAVLIGESRFGLRLPGDIPEDAIGDAIARAHALGIQAYVSVQKLFHNEELAALPGYLRLIGRAGADAAVFSDPAVLMIAREAAPGLKLHWNGEMTATNAASAAFWGRRGACRAVLAPELNAEEIASIKRQAGLDVQVLAHGAAPIYHSERHLLLSYMEHIGREARIADLGLGGGRYLIEADRPNEKLPIFEDQSGTFVLSADDVCLLEALPELLAAGVDSLYVEPLLKTEAYNEAVLAGYRAALDRWAADPDGFVFDERWLDDIRALQPPERELSFGFLYKEQVY